MSVTAVGLLGACSDSSTAPSDPGGPGGPNPPDTTTNPAVLVDRVSIPTSGGEIEVDRADSRLHGLTITLDSGTYPTTTQWTVTEEPEVAPSLPPGITLAAPAFRVGNGQRFANEPFVLRIPVDLDEGEVPTAFIQDPVTGTMELVSPLGIDEDGAHFSVITQHVSRAQMWVPDGGAGQALFNVSPGSETAGLSSAFGEEVRWLIVKREAVGPPGHVETTFRPGVDDWEFPNIGSAISRRGFCAGSTITALYYHYFREPWQGPLFGRFSEFDPEYVIDNAQGVRLASVVQEQLDWQAYGKHRLIWLPLPGYEEYSRPFIQLVSLVTSMEITGLPQLLGVHNATYTSGHALIAYAVDGGTVKIADPNYPGQNVEIRWGDHWVYGSDWEPFSFAEIQGGPASIYSQVFPVGISTLIDVDQLHYRWDQFDAGVAGDAEFPPKEFEYQDPELDDIWRWAGDTIRTANDSLVFRWRCPTCGYHWYTPNDVDRQFTALTPAGVQLEDNNSLDWFDESREGAPLLTEEEGRHRLGAFHATKYDGHPTLWRYANFTWFHVHRFEFEISVDSATPEVGEEVVFRIENEEDLPGMQPRYRWEFGDGSVTEVQGSGTASHTYSDPDTYTVTVELMDAEDEVVARTSTQVEVGQPYTWVGEVTYGRRLTQGGPWRETTFHTTGLRLEPGPTLPGGVQRWLVVEGETSVSMHAEGYNCSYTVAPEVRPVGPGYLDTNSSQVVGYRAYGSMDPWQVTFVVECPGQNPNSYQESHQVWMSTAQNENGALIWSTSANPNLLEGSHSYQLDQYWSWHYTWRFERVSD